ncbi:MAG: ATP-binding cassette domain-containing protein, partial [Erysipelotrichaceae bacterium]
VEPMQTIALVGETGGGKSTIINLLSRFYEPTSGAILIDGIDYKQRSIGWLHSQLGYVLQTPHLFSGSILDNIRYGKPDASLQEVIKICRLLNADEFIQKLPNGYDFEVGEAGSFLSTGQKQLISFARALIHQPNIMILDEATSSIDTEAELLIQHAIDQVVSTTTTFIVAHRLSTIVNADKILVVKKGVVQESGSHTELMKEKGYYYRLYTNQFNQELQKKVFNES